jgi:acetyl-CoA carboxylase biotin carboxyl carrier protein
VSRLPQIEALIENDSSSEGALLVRSPGVGMFGAAPRLGEVVVEGSRAGLLTTLGKRSEVVIPAATTGRVAERLITHLREPVEHGQVLLRLLPVHAEEIGADVEGATTSVDGLPEGTFAITSPTHGMFYRRPSPDAPAYVEPGQVVEAGVTIALVEVMKCFSAITYGGPGLPPRAEVVEIRANDSSEVEADQLLFVMRPSV